MKPALALALAAGLALDGSASAVDVYKWRDAKGVVHYGDRPASGVSASTLSVPDDALSPEDEQAAGERLAQARARLAEQAANDVPVAAAAPRRQKVVSPDCAEAWQRFDYAQSCFASHRAANGRGVSPAGLAVCRPMPQPTCAR
jgi:hypothetical protein